MRSLRPSWWLRIGLLFVLLAIWTPSVGRAQSHDAPPPPQPAPERPTPLLPEPTNSGFMASFRAAALQRDRTASWAIMGPVRTAMQSAAHASFVPLESTADFDLQCDQHGTVRSVEVHTSRAHVRTYRHFADEVLLRLARKPLPLPSYAKRARIRLHFVSHERMPSGNAAPKNTAEKVIFTIAAVLLFEWGDLGASSVRVVSLDTTALDVR